MTTYIMSGAKITVSTPSSTLPHGVLNNPETIFPPGAAHAVSGMRATATMMINNVMKRMDLFINFLCIREPTGKPASCPLPLLFCKQVTDQPARPGDPASLFEMQVNPAAVG